MLPFGAGGVEEVVGVMAVVVTAAAASGDAVGGGSVHRPSDGVHIGEVESEEGRRGACSSKEEVEWLKRLLIIIIIIREGERCLCFQSLKRKSGQERCSIFLHLW